MKQKTILRAEWKGINERLYAEKRFEIKGFKGIAGLLFMADAEDFSVHSGKQRLKITGKGYSWLQLAPENEHVWATVMFDETGKLFQCYFDITACNHVLDGGKSWFEDLYLDVVAIAGDDELYLYDEDELIEARKNDELSEDLFNTAYTARRKLINALNIHKQAFFDACCALRSELMPKLGSVKG